MNREDMIQRLESEKTSWDIIVIGGGATGMGIAVDAASRGYRTLLLEQHDFGKGTSSRSTKLIHGGVRYLQQGNVSLVLESLKERGILLKNAPHLVHDCPFIVPNYDWWEGPFYGVGLKLYDLLAGKHGFGTSEHLSKEETIKRIPTIEQKDLKGGVIYYDGQFDDARLVIDLAKTAFEQGALVLNYMPVIGLVHKQDLVCGVRIQDVITEKTYEISAKAVINATGVFADSIIRMDFPQAPPFIQASQGIHLVLDRSFLPGDSAIMVPHTDDGRILFAVPWHGKIIIGTTDTPVDSISLEPRPLQEEIDFVLTHAARYLSKDPQPEDVKSAFAGLRPLIRTADGLNTANLSRDFKILISRYGLLTIGGGKWTNYRKMAEETVDQAVSVAQLDMVPSKTTDLPIHGYHRNADRFGSLHIYGADAPEMQDLFLEIPNWQKKLHPDSDILAGEVVWSVREEMAVQVEDFLSRRSRILLLDARLSLKMAPAVADLMASELGKDKTWKQNQIEAYTNLVQRYLLPHLAISLTS